MHKLLIPLTGLLLMGFMFVACDDEDECDWDPTVESTADGCVISTSGGESDCWGGITVTCTLNEDSTNYFCEAVGEDACEQPIDVTDVSAPSCDWFVDEASTEIYAEVWANCWAWDEEWFYW